MIAVEKIETEGKSVEVDRETRRTELSSVRFFLFIHTVVEQRLFLILMIHQLNYNTGVMILNIKSAIVIATAFHFRKGDYDEDN